MCENSETDDARKLREEAECNVERDVLAAMRIWHDVLRNATHSTEMHDIARLIAEERQRMRDEP